MWCFLNMYTTEKNFTRPQVARVAPNINSVPSCTSLFIIVLISLSFSQFSDFQEASGNIWSFSFPFDILIIYEMPFIFVMFTALMVFFLNLDSFSWTWIVFTGNSQFKFNLCISFPHQELYYGQPLVSSTHLLCSISNKQSFRSNIPTLEAQAPST